MLILAAAVVLHHLVIAVDPATLRAVGDAPFVRNELATASKPSPTRIVLQGANTSVELVDASTLPKGHAPFELVFSTTDVARFSDDRPKWLTITAAPPPHSSAKRIVRSVSALDLEVSADDARKLGMFIGKAGAIAGLQIHVHIAGKPRGLTRIDLATRAKRTPEAARLGRTLFSCSAATVCTWRFGTEAPPL